LLKFSAANQRTPFLKFASVHTLIQFLLRNTTGTMNLFAIATITVVAAGTATAAAGAIMTALGFGSSGIMAGSVAAGTQSVIGNVIAGTFFASCQSIGALGGWLTMSVVGVSALGLGVSALFLII
jgi:hypothetical protein